jgi:diketogulonate reductase-like aldo/keto reductase
MAYSPIDQGALAANPALGAIARKLGISAVQLALAWVLAQPGVVAIPKAVREAHLRENLAAVGLDLSAGTRAEIDRLLPPPRRKGALAMI